MPDKQYYVYIVSNKWNTTFYIGITNNLLRRTWEHQEKEIDGFSKKYNLTKLVYYEMYQTPYEAISRERQLKRWSRSKKITRIKSLNPQLEDLFASITA